MRTCQRLLLCVALLGLGRTASAAWVNVNAATAGSTNCTAAASVSGVDMTAGGNADSLFMFISSASTAEATPSDSSSNTWLDAPPSQRAPGGTTGGRWWYVKNATVTNSMTFSATNAGTHCASFVVYGFRGGHLTTPYDTESSGVTFSSTTTSGAFSATLAGANELIVAGIAFDGANTPTITDAAGSVYSAVTETNLGGGAHYGSAAAYWIQTTQTNPSTTWNWGGGTAASGGASLAAFKIAAAGGAVTCTLPLLGVGKC